jgi:hypothetical protein
MQLETNGLASDLPGFNKYALIGSLDRTRAVPCVGHRGGTGADRKFHEPFAGLSNH